jgi:high-affinity nickel-transport protein
VIGSIELVSVLQRRLHLDDPVSTWIAGVSIDRFGFIVVTMFVATWIVAIAYWKFGRLESGSSGRLRPIERFSRCDCRDRAARPHPSAR